MTPRAHIEAAFAEALAASDPEQSVREALARLKPVRPVHVIAIGKAAAPMLSAALDELGPAVARAFLITKYEHLDRAFDHRVVCREAGHPVLDQASIDATGELLEWCGSVPGNDMVVVLLSGGGSALLERPIPGVTLSEFQTMTRELLRAGADIYQLNAVRSQVSQVKGGRLRWAIPAARVDTLALSDVLGNDLTVIASGPTVAPKRTREDARAVLDVLQVRHSMPETVLRALDEDRREPPFTFPDDRVEIIADNSQAVSAVVDFFRASGMVVTQRLQIVSGDAREVAAEWVRSLRGEPDGVDAVVAGGELTVTVTGDGIGGRNTEFALAAALELERLDLREWAVASLATDGQDALTGVAGAIVDGSTAARIRDRGLDPLAALAANDSFPCLEAVGASLRTGPTGTNVNDLYFGVRMPAG